MATELEEPQTYAEAMRAFAIKSSCKYCVKSSLQVCTACFNSIPEKITTCILART